MRFLILVLLKREQTTMLSFQGLEIYFKHYSQYGLMIYYITDVISNIKEILSSRSILQDSILKRNI